jgi:hypothetical protein
MESVIQRHERLLQKIEENTRAEGITPADRGRLESFVRDLRPGRINAILSGELAMYWDPEVPGLRARTEAST